MTKHPKPAVLTVVAVTAYSVVAPLVDPCGWFRADAQVLPAPTGHRQPTDRDVAKIDPSQKNPTVSPEDRALDRALKNVCRGCSPTVAVGKVPRYDVAVTCGEPARDGQEHFSPEERARIIASYLPHERDARIKGLPQLGSGRIFPVSEELIACERRDIPKYWPRLCAMDFGWDHPFAAVELAWDRDHDTVYVIKAYRIREATPVIHAAALKPWGRLPWAWPRDGRRETLEGAGIALAQQYRAQGLDMIHTHAQFQPESGSVSVEAGLLDMLTRMETGRFKVFHDLEDWFQEFRLYHRKDGKVVKEGDDLMSATRYGVMMLRYARTVEFADRFNRDIVYRAVGYA
jgi:hypothetical protein